VKEQHLVFLKKRNNEKFTTSYSNLLPKDTTTISKCSACEVSQVAVLFLFRLNIIIELAFIDVSTENFLTVLLCVNNPINFFLKNVTLYNYFIIYSRKELTNETFRPERKFVYNMRAKTYFTLHFTVCLMYQVLDTLFFIDDKISSVPNFVFRWHFYIHALK